MLESIRAEGLVGEQVLHAIPVEPDRWHCVDVQRCAGISVYNRETLITRIADMIGEGLIYRLDIKDAMLIIDRAGNVWRNHEYKAPHEYLPELIEP